MTIILELPLKTINGIKREEEKTKNILEGKKKIEWATTFSLLRVKYKSAKSSLHTNYVRIQSKLCSFSENNIY